MTEFVPSAAIALAVVGPVALFAFASLAAYLGSAKATVRARRRH